MLALQQDGDVREPLLDTNQPQNLVVDYFTNLRASPQTSLGILSSRQTTAVSPRSITYPQHPSQALIEELTSNSNHMHSQRYVNRPSSPESRRDTIDTLPGQSAEVEFLRKSVEDRLDMSDKQIAPSQNLYNMYGGNKKNKKTWDCLDQDGQKAEVIPTFRSVTVENEEEKMKKVGAAVCDEPVQSSPAQSIKEELTESASRPSRLQANAGHMEETPHEEANEDTDNDVKTIEEEVQPIEGEDKNVSDEDFNF